MGTILYCRKCNAGYGSLGEVPPLCPACDQETSWTTTPPVVSSQNPTVPYVLTFNDVRFLRKQLGIDPEVQFTAR